MRKDDNKSWEEKVVRTQVKDEKFDKVSRGETKPRTDEIFCKQVATEKVTITGNRDTIQREETERPRYPKEQDIGRILIEEIPEKEEVQTAKVPRKQEVKPRNTDVKVTGAIKDVPRKYITEEVVKVGKLDTADFERKTGESKRIEERVTTYTDRVDGARKVFIIDRKSNSIFQTEKSLKTIRYLKVNSDRKFSSTIE